MPHCPAVASRTRASARRLALVLGLASLGGCGRPPAASSPETGAQAPSSTPPNVVLYVVDTLRADHLGCLGHPGDPTPAMDELARHGVLFEHAAAPAPWTLPSVASILTSTLACEHGVTVPGHRVPPGLPTLAERLADAGYRTASFHENPYAGRATDLCRGYEECELVKPVTLAPVKRWLAAADDRPFFLYFHSMEPHDPNWPREDEVDEGRASLVNRALRNLTRTYTGDFSAGREPDVAAVTARQVALHEHLDRVARDAGQLYRGEVTNADELLAELVRFMKDEDAWKNTLFVFLSDHGEELGDHGGWLHGQSAYDELIRVPLIMRFPGDAHAGERVTRPVALLDVLPTILDVTGLTDAAGTVRGASLLPSLSGSGAPAETPRVVAMRLNQHMVHGVFLEARGDVNVVVRQGPWKGILNVDRRTAELYDIVTDPGERTNLLLADGEERRGRDMMRLAMEHVAACSPDGGFEEPSVELLERIDPESLEALRALGYVQ